MLIWDLCRAILVLECCFPKIRVVLLDYLIQEYVQRQGRNDEWYIVKNVVFFNSSCHFLDHIVRYDTDMSVDLAKDRNWAEGHTKLDFTIKEKEHVG